MLQQKTNNKKNTAASYLDFLELTTPSDLIKITVTEEQGQEMKETVDEIIQGKEKDYEKAQAIHAWISKI